jgi:hypothetical protein
VDRAVDLRGRAMSSAVYFTAPDGTRYRVLDTAWKDGRRVVANPPAAWATTRVFNAEDGSSRFYPLAFLELHDETKEPKPEWLARQFARSERGAGKGARTLAERAIAAQSDAAAHP